MTKIFPTKRRLMAIRVFGLALLLMVIGSAAASDVLTGKVVAIAAGDTLALLVAKTQVKVRLDGIDSPEIGAVLRGQGEARTVSQGVRHNSNGA